MLDDDLSLLECHNMSTGHHSTSQGSDIPEDIICNLLNNVSNSRTQLTKTIYNVCCWLLTNVTSLVLMGKNDRLLIQRGFKKWPLTACFMKLWLCYPHDGHVQITNEIC